MLTIAYRAFTVNPASPTSCLVWAVIHKQSLYTKNENILYAVVYIWPGILDSSLNKIYHLPSKLVYSLVCPTNQCLNRDLSLQPPTDCLPDLPMLSKWVIGAREKAMGDGWCLVVSFKGLCKYSSNLRPIWCHSTDTPQAQIEPCKTGLWHVTHTQEDLEFGPVRCKAIGLSLRIHLIREHFHEIDMVSW